MMLSDLPDEVLCCIFDHLDVGGMRRAALVCQRWSNLVFSGRRMDRVLLRPKPDECPVLLNSKRSYRHMFLRFFDCTAPEFADGMLEKILHKFGLSISSLRIESYFIVTIAMFRKILLEVPHVQKLTINMSFPDEDTETIASFPALAKLKYLELHISECNIPLFRDALNLPTNSPRLEQLCLNTDEGAFFNVLEHFSPQLKVVDVVDASEEFLLLNFPRLRELQLRRVTTTTPQLSLDFFRRHSSIQELKIYNAIPLDLFEFITSHCRNITYLGLATSNLHRTGDFKSLDQLTKLKHLEIVDDGERDDSNVEVFKGCGVISSLEKISFHKIRDIHHWSLLTKQVAPQLKCLQFTGTIYRFNSSVVKFFDVICKYCSHIDSIILECFEVVRLFKFCIAAVAGVKVANTITLLLHTLAEGRFQLLGKTTTPT